MLKRIYNVCVASRALYMPVFSGLSTALLDLVHPIDSAACPPAAHLRMLWESLQLGEELVNELVHFRVLSREGILGVDMAAMQEADAITRLSACLLGVWAFKSFSGSRWLTIGQSCRTLVAAWLTGYDLITDALANADQLPAYEMGALNAIDGVCRRFVCQASYVSLLPEALLAHVFKDNRVAKTQHLLQDLCWTGLQFLENLYAFCLEVIGQIGGMSALEFHHCLLKSTLIQLSFLDKRVFQVTRSYPWRLCSGSIETNLAQLLSNDSLCQAEHDHVTMSLIALHKMGYSERTLARALRLLGETSWSSFLVV